MRIQTFEVRPDGSLGAEEFDAALERWRLGGGPFWVDIEASSRAEALDGLAALDLGEETRQRFADRSHAARAVTVDRGVLLEVPTRIAGDPPELRSYVLLGMDRLLITAHLPPDELDTRSAETVARDLLLDRPTVTHLVGNLLVELSVELRDQSAGLRDRVTAMSARLEAAPEEVEAPEILALKRSVIDLEAASEERIPVLSRLHRLRSSLLDLSEISDLLEIALANTEATSRRLDRLERRAEDLQSRFDAHHQELTNRRLGRLTVISAIFLPLTLLAGIYGMNFEVMPELAWPFAYPVLLGFMVVLSALMVRWFKTHGWME
jgi:Mg2+ and Co2+ transporter CorA